MSKAPLAQLSRGFLTLGAGEVAARVVAFLATAYITQTIGPANFGIIGVALAAMLYAQRVVTWELESAGIIEVLDPGPSAERAIGSLLLARALTAAVLVAIAALAAGLFLPPTDGAVILSYSVGLMFVAMNSRFVYLMRNRPGAASGARLIAEVVAVLTVVLLVRGPADTVKVPQGFIAGEALAAVLLLAGVGGLRILGNFDGRYALRTAAKTAPLVLSSMLGLVVFNLDLIMLRFMRGAESAGYYAAAYALVGLILNVGLAFYLNLVPGLTRLRGDSETQRQLYRSASFLMLMLALPIVVGGSLLSDRLIVTVFGAGFAPAAEPLPLLLVSTGLTLARLVPQAAVIAAERRQDVLWINAVGAVVSLILNFVLIPRFGIMGAALSTFGTDLLRLPVAYWFGGRVGSGIRRSVSSDMWRVVGAAVLMGVAVWFMHDWPIWFSVPLGALAYGVGLVLFGAFGKIRGAERLKS